MSNPVYASQVIRFVETVSAASVGTGAIEAHRIVGLDLDANGELIPQAEASGAAFRTLGVNLHRIPAAGDTSPAVGYRNASVATSGNLVVEIDTANAPAIGADLVVDGLGRARAATGVAGTDYFVVDVNGTTPSVREVVGQYAVVSFV